MTPETKKVLYLGPCGTYSHQAALQEFGEDISYHLSPTKTIPECLSELENDRSVHYAVIPLENSTNGQVVFSYDLLRDRMVKSLQCSISNNRVIPQLEIIAEQYVSIEHCLISKTPINILQLGEYKTVKIYSHPQVWGQVSEYLSTLRNKYPNTTFEEHDTSSTSDAVARIISSETNEEKESVLRLAIGSEVAAKLYKVEVLQKRINDKLGNTTRFLVFKRREDDLPRTPDTETVKVELMTFTIKQDDSGALVDVLTVLKEYSVNMCSINTRPFNGGSPSRKWQYVFFLEYYHNDKTDWNNFYQSFGSHCFEWCIWGTFYRNSNYYN